MHSVFHVSHLHKSIGIDDNVVDTSVLVDYIEPPSLPREPDCILDVQEKCTHHSFQQECLVKWRDRTEEGST